MYNIIDLLEILCTTMWCDANRHEVELITVHILGLLFRSCRININVFGICNFGAYFVFQTEQSDAITIPLRDAGLYLSHTSRKPSLQWRVISGMTNSHCSLPNNVFVSAIWVIASLEDPDYILMLMFLFIIILKFIFLPYQSHKAPIFPFQHISILMSSSVGKRNTRPRINTRGTSYILLVRPFLQDVCESVYVWGGGGWVDGVHKSWR